MRSKCDGGLVDKDTQSKFAVLLRKAAAQDISEDDFWAQFKNLVDAFEYPSAGLAFETATTIGGISTREICCLCGLNLIAISCSRVKTSSI